MLFSTIILIFFSSSRYCSGNRIKRVTHGTRVMGRAGPYEAVQYIVSMGSLHGQKWNAWGFRKLKDNGIYGRHNCGGSLLTPSIVQTACHCLAYFDENSPNPVVHNNWEGIKVVYIGLNDRFGGEGSSESFANRNPVKSRKFMASQKCTKQPREDEPGAQLSSYDSGYIVIEPEWISGKIGVPTREVKFAPIYTLEGLKKTYKDFIKTPPVCLNLGWGYYDDTKVASPFLRSGWSQVMDPTQCRWATAPYWSDDQVAEYMSWVCGDNIPHLFQPPDCGDSGGPVSCNNVYFGVQSFAFVDEEDFPPEFKAYRVTGIEVLINSEYQNTIEYRKAFEEEIDAWVGTDSTPQKRKRLLRNAQKLLNPAVGEIPTDNSRLLHQQKFVDSFTPIHVPSVCHFILLNVQLLSLFCA